MERITITIPKWYNSGLRVSQRDHDDIEAGLIARFNGFTRLDVYGQWTNESGILYSDESYWYEILTDSPDAYGELIAFAKRLIGILDQQCILTTCETVQADFVG